MIRYWRVLEATQPTPVQWRLLLITAGAFLASQLGIWGAYALYLVHEGRF